MRPTTRASSSRSRATTASATCRLLDKKTGLYQPLDLKKTYTLGGIDYTITYCGDGFTMFKDSKVLKAGDATMTDAQTVLSYIETKLGGTIGEEYAKPAGRITIYSDVKATDWYLKAVKYALDAGLMNGVGSGFAPNGALTRGMLVTILYRQAGSPAVTTKVSDKFSDCVEDSWYAPAVVWAAENNIVGGYAGRHVHAQQGNHPSGDGEGPLRLRQGDRQGEGRCRLPS